MQMYRQIQEECGFQIYIRSIDYNRSIEGASAKLAGMLPIKEPMLEKLRGWPSRWMPMPIHMVSLDEDIVSTIRRHTIGPIGALRRRLLSEPQYGSELSKISRFFQYYESDTSIQ